ncbi:MAG: PEP-CTERM sorting domain-containing protein [bacterium]|nr:PEP-CTERM sorting domain-containing protein [bacterium]
MKMTLILMICVLFLGGTALADWDPGDGHKMHYPQLPDPTGWDISASNWYQGLLADDWQCSQSGPVDDIHIWGSWKGDAIDTITAVHVSIHSDIPDPDGPTGPEYSMPGTLLWERDFTSTQFTVRDYGTGDQGFYWPAGSTGGVWPGDHTKYHQINFDNIANPFIQQEGTIYWLDIQVTHSSDTTWWGWKTTQNHWNDDAVWWDYSNQQWQELRDPLNPVSGESLDLAFVITPEPTTMVLMAMGSLAMIRRRKR